MSRTGNHTAESFRFNGAGYKRQLSGLLVWLYHNLQALLD